MINMKNSFLVFLLVSVALFALVGLSKSWHPGNSSSGGGGGRRRRSWYTRRRSQYCRSIGQIIDCELHDWTSFGGCSRTCGTGSLSQRRNIKTRSRCHGLPCPLMNSPQRYRTIPCNTQCCPVNCLWSWNSWSPCRGCGVSRQTRKMYFRYPSCGGTSCPSRKSETRSCNTGV